jgi:hypothetical protein
MTEPRAIVPLDLGKLTRDDIDQLRAQKWTDADRAVSKLDTLPIHLQSVVSIISTHGNRNYENQNGVVIPGNSVIRLYSASGTIDMGWQRLVGPSGRFVDNGEILGPAGSDFTRSGVNRYCMLVQTPKVFFLNTGVPNWGASVEAYWNVGANDGGQVMVAFNDNDNNNSGTFNQFLEIREASAFAEWVSHLAR